MVGRWTSGFARPFRGRQRDSAQRPLFLLPEPPMTRKKQLRPSLEKELAEVVTVQ